MKITRKAIDVTLFAVVSIVAVLVVGYAFKAFQEINAMDLSGLNDACFGKEATIITEDESSARAADAEAVTKVKTVIYNCMGDENVVSNVRADYANHRIVYLMLANGTANAVKNNDTDEWNKIKDLGEKTSLEGEEILRDNGLDDWSFDIEILNDVHPSRAVLAFNDGECTYDCLSE